MTIPYRTAKLYSGQYFQLYSIETKFQEFGTPRALQEYVADESEYATHTKLIWLTEEIEEISKRLAADHNCLCIIMLSGFVPIRERKCRPGVSTFLTR